MSGNDFNIKKDEPLKKTGDVKYIIKGLGTNAVSTALYRAGVNNVIERNGGNVRDEALYKSALGTDVVTDLTIPAFDYTDNDGNLQTVPEIKLYNILVNVKGQKNIVETPIQGLEGTIKEYISNEDDNVNIKIKIDGKNGAYPFQLVNDIKKLIDAPVAFKVISKILQNLDIDTLVIYDYDIPQKEGGYSTQEIELNCSTDFPIELNIVSASNTTVGSSTMF